MKKNAHRRSANRVRDRYLKQVKPRNKVAGEVRFIKDRSGDKNQWAWGDAPPSSREITSEYAFDPKNIKPLAECLWSSTVAMGHVLSAQAKFVKIKSATVSPDGSLGGRGYIQKIADMRRAYMNIAESLSSLSDTLFDEIRAPHWAALSRETDPALREEIKTIVDDIEEVKEDPKGWAEKEMKEEMAEHNAPSRKKKASIPSAQDQVVRRYLKQEPRR
jgi:hypothetical protein